MLLGCWLPFYPPFYLQASGYLDNALASARYVLIWLDLNAVFQISISDKRLFGSEILTWKVLIKAIKTIQEEKMELDGPKKGYKDHQGGKNGAGWS